MLSRRKKTPKQLEDLAKCVKSEAESFECKFVEPFPKEVQTDCSICLQTLKEPYVVECCGNRYCKDCIEPPFQHPIRTCPLCKAYGFIKIRDKQLERLLNQRKVYCLLQDSGCTWTGELNKLPIHLNFDEEQLSITSVSSSSKMDICEYLPVPCSYCKEYVRRIHMKTHKDACDLKPCSCKYCDFECLKKDIMHHYSECLEYPILCKNLCCFERLMRKDLENHLADDCPWERVHCEYHYAGCEVEIFRKEKAEHNKTNMKYHLDLLSVKYKELIKEKAQLSEKCSQLEDTSDDWKERYYTTDSLCDLYMAKLESLHVNEEKDIKYLVVSNLPEGAHYHLVKSRFGQYGSVICIESIESRNSAIIEYSDIVGYRRAIKASKNPGINLLQHRLQVHPIYVD